MPRVALTTATLDYERGLTVCREAAATAGVPVSVHIGYDRFALGGVKAANVAWRAALEQGFDYLCYINDDVRMPQQNWLKALIRAVNTKERYGIVAPGGACVTNPQRKGKPGMDHHVEPVKSLAFFTVVIKRAVVDEIGLLDERYTHFAVDTDYCNRAQAAGWVTVWAAHVHVKHDYRPVKSRPAKVRKWKAQDMKEFWERWGKPKKKRKK